jgi:DNA polymerase III epsilon subunit-like protein
VSSVLDDAYVSVDVEASGPNPSDYSLLAIGACLAFEPDTTFYVELQPVSDASTPQAMAVGGLDLAQLRAEGAPPQQAMREFAAWIATSVPSDRQPVFVGFNAPFDWMFVADYFHRFLGRNPFAHKALDIKSLAMGATGCRWDETSYHDLSARFGIEHGSLTHHALEDARVQASLFRNIIRAMNTERSG